MQAIQRMSATQRQWQQTGKYRELVGIAEQVVACARSALKDSHNGRGKDLFCDLAIAGLRNEIDRYCGLADRVIDQARRRVLEGEQVPTAEKIYSIFEPHTDLIKRGKVRTPLEFGHKVFLAESAKGPDHAIPGAQGQSARRAACRPITATPPQGLRCAPDLYGADRGFFSERNLTLCEHSGRQGGVHPTIRRQESA